MGLDPGTVRSISALLHRLAQKCSPRLILALRPQDKVPDWITQRMILGNNHSILTQGSTDYIHHMLKVWGSLLGKMPNKASTATTAPIEVDGTGEESRPALKKVTGNGLILSRGRTKLKTGELDKELLEDLMQRKPENTADYEDASLDGQPIIEMDGVRVQYGDKVVLGDWTQQVNLEEKEGLHWEVRRGQHWAILGANGTGKTTLLSMITSDHPQAYAQPVKLFGRSRLPEPGVPAISIFELQSRLGHSSPEIHAFFPRQLTIRQTLESAFAETFLAKPKLNAQADHSVDIFLALWKAELDPNHDGSEVTRVSTDHFPLPHKGHRYPRPPTAQYALDVITEYADCLTFGQLSVAHQRILLFLRTLIARPDIVILDEAFSGLSASQREKCLEFLRSGQVTHKTGIIIPPSEENQSTFTGLTEDQALIVISHVPEEIPDSVRFFMRLPSDSGPGTKPLDFHIGTLRQNSALRLPKCWESAWLPSSEFPRRLWGTEDQTLKET